MHFLFFLKHASYNYCCFHDSISKIDLRFKILLVQFVKTIDKRIFFIKMI